MRSFSLTFKSTRLSLTRLHFVPLAAVALTVTTLISNISQAQVKPSWDLLAPYNAMYENNNTDPTPGQGMQGCLRDAGAESWHTAKTDNKGNLVPFCAPDTLYV